MFSLATLAGERSLAGAFLSTGLRLLLAERLRALLFRAGGEPRRRGGERDRDGERERERLRSFGLLEMDRGLARGGGERDLDLESCRRRGGGGDLERRLAYRVRAGGERERRGGGPLW